MSEGIPADRNQVDTDVTNRESSERPELPDFDIQYEYIDSDNELNDNLIPNDRGASFANIVQATVVETSARSVRDPSIGSKCHY